MQTTTCYHGTTRRGLNSILSGSGVKPNSPWTVSDNDGLMYVWPKDKLEEVNGYDDEEQMIRQALETAEIQAAVSGETKIYALILEIPNTLLEDDFSCENMREEASCLFMSDFDKSMIVGVKEAVVSKWNAPLVIANLLGNVYFNTYSIDEDLLKVAKVLSESDAYIEFGNYDYEDYKY